MGVETINGDERDEPDHPDYTCGKSSEADGRTIVRVQGYYTHSNATTIILQLATLGFSVNADRDDSGDMVIEASRGSSGGPSSSKIKMALEFAKDHLEASAPGSAAHTLVMDTLWEIEREEKGL